MLKVINIHKMNKNTNVKTNFILVVYFTFGKILYNHKITPKLHRENVVAKL